MDQNETKLLQETKQIIKSLVIPHPNGLRLNTLCHEYEEIEGKQLPYREFGFKSLIQFLKSIPDVVRMYGDLQYIHTVVLFPVADESTAHIVKMVAEQAKNKRAKKKSPVSNSKFRTSPDNRFRFSTQFPLTPLPYASKMTHFHNRPLLPQSFNSNLQLSRTSAPQTQSNPFNFKGSKSPNKWQNFTVTRNMTSHPNPNSANYKRLKANSNPSLNTITQPLSGHEVQLKSKSPFVPSDIKDNLRQLMSSRDMEDGLMLFNFDARYKYQFKESLDWKKFGFSSLVDCLKSMPQLVTLIPTGTSTYKIMPSKSDSANSSRSIVGRLDSSLTRSTTSTTSLPKNLTTTFLTNEHSMAIVTRTTSSTTVKLVTTSATVTTTSVTTQNSMTQGKVTPIETPQTSSNISNLSTPSTSPTSHIDLNKRAIQNFRRILSLFPNGIQAIQFIVEYEKEFKVLFDSRIWGFQSPMELFYSFPSIFAIEIPKDSSEPILHDARFKKFDKPKPVPTTDSTLLCYLSNIPDLIIARIVKLIELNMPSGLPLPCFLEEYKINYGDIDLSQMRICDTTHLFNVLKTGTPIELKVVDGINRAFLKSESEVHSWVSLCTRLQRYIIAITIIDCVPPNVALPGDQYKPLELPPGVQVDNNEYVAVLISSAVSPSEVYIQFKGDNYHSALEKLMAQLDFYSYCDEDEWRVPKQFLCLGLPVVTKFPGDRHWHRARITKLHPKPNDRNITVTFVDYGGILVTDFKDLRLIKREFLVLPTQALRVSIYGIKPILGETEGWTAAARDKVLRFSKRGYYLACTFIEKSDDLYYVCLCDTNSDSDIFIHNVLVDDKHAVFEDGVLNQSQDESYAQNHNQLTNGLDETHIRTETMNANNVNDNEINSLKAPGIQSAQNNTISDDLRDQIWKIYHIKWISWKGKKTPIITQNSNGACPLIAILNVLILSQRITLQSTKHTYTGQELVSFLTQFILSNLSIRYRHLVNLIIDQSVLFRFLTGIDVNIQFNGITKFESTLEIKLFELLQIPLYHGWIVDQQNESLVSFIADLTYNDLIDKILINKISTNPELAAMALATEQFLSSSSAQLTFNGLSQLQNELNEEELCVLFRNNHFITLYVHNNSLYQLVTDQGFINEKSVVWETLTNINGDEDFVDENFVKYRNVDSLELDYQLARSIDQQFNQNDGWNINWDNDWNTESQTQNSNDWSTSWDLKNPSWQPNIDWGTNSKWNGSKIETRKHKFNHKSSKQKPRSNWFQHCHRDYDNHSNKQNELVLENNRVSKVDVSQPLRIAIESTIDATDNISSLQLPEPLIPEPVSTTAKTAPNFVPTNELNRSDSKKNTTPTPISPKTTIDRSDYSSTVNSYIPSSVSVDDLRDVAQKVTSEELTNTDEQHIGNECTVSARNLSLINNLDLTPTNSGSDTESVGDTKDTKIGDNDFTDEDIRSARLKIIDINNKSVHLIYYKEEFYFNYEDLNNIFQDVELWNLISFSGGYIKGRIQLKEEEGKALFRHLNIKYQFDRRLVFLYPQESIIEFTSLSGQSEVKAMIKKSVNEFVNNIVLTEKAKYESLIYALQKKVNKIQI